ncbi:hypothetical protein [Nocardia farcinica]
MTPEDAEQLAIDATQTAISLTARVREDEPAAIWSHLAGLTREHLHATVIVLAAMVPVDADPERLLAWVDAIAVTQPTPAQQQRHARLIAAAHARDHQELAMFLSMLALDGKEDAA